MQVTQLYLQAGARVRMRQDYEDPAARDSLLGCRGSIGVVISIDDYLAYGQDIMAPHLPYFRREQCQLYEQHLRQERRAVERGWYYPLRFETVQTPSKETLRWYGPDYCSTGAIALIAAYALEKLNRLDEQAYIVLDQPRFVDRYGALEAAAGQTVLCLILRVESAAPGTPGWPALPHAWLTTPTTPSFRPPK